jgi:hypothetical protein
MPANRSAADILDRQFLETRAKILQVAAELDRIDRGEGSVESDPRLEQVRRALEVLLAAGPERAEQVQMIFSRDYDTQWKEQFGLSARSAQ